LQSSRKRFGLEHREGDLCWSLCYERGSTATPRTTVVVTTSTRFTRGAHVIPARVCAVKVPAKYRELGGTVGS